MGDATEVILYTVGNLLMMVFGGVLTYLYLKSTDRMQAPQIYKWICKDCSIKVSSADPTIIITFADDHMEVVHGSRGS